jgi:O-antigen/teichoic acid export membrane protein
LTRDRRFRGAPAIRGELAPIAIFVSSEGGARLLSFGFYLLAARVLTTHGFGVVRYTLTLSVLAFGVGQVLATALTREVGAARNEPARLGSVLGSGLAAGGAVVIGSCALCAGATLLGLTGSASPAGLVLTVAGFGVFQLYYGIGRGLGERMRPASTYLAASAVQLVALGALAVLTDPSPIDVLLAYALSNLVPVLAWEWRRPAIRGRRLAVAGDEFARIGALARPLLLAELCWLVWLSADQVWVESVLGTRSVALYGAAKTLAQVLFVVPSGAMAVLLPRLAELRTAGEGQRARTLTAVATFGVLGVSAVLAPCIILLRSSLLTGLYGPAYGAAAPSLLLLALGTVASATFMTLTSAVIGWGRPRVYTAGIAGAAALELVLLAVLPDDSATSAAWAASVSIAVALVGVAAWLRARPLGAEGRPPASTPSGEPVPDAVPDPPAP